MFSFPSEEREGERERERDRETYELASVSLSFFLRSLSLASFFFFFFFFGESCTCTEFRVDKKGPNASIAVHFPVFSLDFVWNFQVIYHRIFLYRFFFRSLLHLTSFCSQKKKKKKTSNMNVCRFSFHDPWTVIGAWTAIGDGPVIVDHCVVK